MAEDLFDDVLDIEHRFYQEGFDAGATDGARAGVTEGKIFGIEKGYDKALELGRLHGRALVWKDRQGLGTPMFSGGAESVPATDKLSNKADGSLVDAASHMQPLPKGSRLEKNIDSLLTLTDPTGVPKDNDDESVEKIEDLIVKATSKAKIIATTIGEQFDPTITIASSIEDSAGLSARQ